MYGETRQPGHTQTE